MRKVTDPSTVEVDARNLGEAIDKLDKVVPGIKSELCDERGEPIVTAFDFYINGSSSYPSKSTTHLAEGDEIIIVPLGLDEGG